MKIVTFGPERRTGVLRDETVVDISLAFAKYLKERQGERHPRRLANALCPPELGHFIEGGQRALDNAQKALDYLFSEVQHQKGTYGEKLILTASEVTLHAPVPAGARIACAGGNFADHAAAMANRNRTGDVKPFAGDPTAEIRKTGIWGFWKITRDMVEPDGELIYPARCNRLDYEGELAIVIGKEGKDIRAKDVKDYIWGITLLGDWSIRGVAEPGPLRFAMQKNFDSCCSLGPVHLGGRGRRAQRPGRDLRQRRAPAELQHQGHGVLVRRVPRVPVARPDLLSGRHHQRRHRRRHGRGFEPLAGRWHAVGRAVLEARRYRRSEVARGRRAQDARRGEEERVAHTAPALRKPSISAAA